MNYKKIISSRKFRIMILHLLRFVPDRLMVPLQYRIHTGRKLKMDNPVRFTDKIQWYKLNYRNPDMLCCTDKYEVRKFVEKLGLKENLIPLIGVYDNPNTIDFNSLPNEFVVKTTDGGGGNQVLICRDKSSMEEKHFYNVIREWMRDSKGKSAGREWAYENGFPRRIIIERLLHQKTNFKELPDYKFYCFNGVPKYCQVVGNRHTLETIDFFDMNWRHMPFTGLNPSPTNVIENSTSVIPKPDSLEIMTEIAAKLSSKFPFARIDLYDSSEGIFFGEITFYPASGYGHFSPDEWDIKLGNLLKLDSQNCFQ